MKKQHPRDKQLNAACEQFSHHFLKLKDHIIYKEIGEQKNRLEDDYSVVQPEGMT